MPPFEDDPYLFVVFYGCKLTNACRSVIAAPVVVERIQQLTFDYGIDIPLNTENLLIEAVQDFQTYTQCIGGAQCLLSAARDNTWNSSTCSCSGEFIDAIITFLPYSPYNVNSSTATCFEQLKGMERTPSTVRAALWICQDVNPLNTMIGLRYDGFRYTLPEFITKNSAFEDIVNLGVPVAYMSLSIASQFQRQLSPASGPSTLTPGTVSVLLLALLLLHV